MTTNTIQITPVPFYSILMVAVFNLFLLIFLFLIYCSSLSRPAGFEVFIPPVIESENLQNDQTVTITAENIFYLNGKVVTLNELRKNLAKIDFSHRNIFIRVDRHSSMGRVMDVWDLCRAMGNAQVHIVTDQRN